MLYFKHPDMKIVEEMSRVVEMAEEHYQEKMSDCTDSASVYQLCTDFLIDINMAHMIANEYVKKYHLRNLWKDRNIKAKLEITLAQFKEKWNVE